MHHIIHPGRDMVEETPRITIEDLRAWGLIPGPGEERQGTITLSRDGVMTGSLRATVRMDGVMSFIRFEYVLGEEKRPVRYEHGLECFPCYLGGHRIYFRCGRCFRRVAALYLSGGYYACRHCHDLAYMVSQEHGSIFEMIDRANHLRSLAKRLRKYGHPRKANRLLARAEKLKGASDWMAAQWVRRRARR